MQEVTNVLRLSKRVGGLKPSGIRKFFDIAATMKDVISLGIGEPDFTTPKPIPKEQSLHSEGQAYIERYKVKNRKAHYEIRTVVNLFLQATGPSGLGKSRWSITESSSCC